MIFIGDIKAVDPHHLVCTLFLHHDGESSSLPCFRVYVFEMSHHYSN